MEIVKDNETLVIKLSGRIDSGNAAEVEADIMAACAENEHNKVIIDAENLEYISSAGLRVILKLKKSEKSAEVINASSEVYDIFDMTGFTDIIDVKKAFRKISVDGCEIIGKGGHGTVYRIDKDTIVKLYNETEPFNEIQREVDYSKTAFVYGIPTAISYDIVKCGNCYGVVFELINSDTLANAMMSEPDRFNEYSKKYNELIHTLHTTEVDINRFSSIKDLYNGWVDDMSNYFTADEIAKLHELINSVPDRKTLVHGDIHPKNIMVQNGELVLIDMADLTYGHPIFDYGGMGLTHVLAGRNKPEITIDRIGIDYQSALKIWDNLLSSEFEVKTDDEMKEIKELINGFILLKFAIVGAVNKTMPEEDCRRYVGISKQMFLPNIDKYIGKINF